jgi:hypothetical protein
MIEAVLNKPDFWFLGVPLLRRVGALQVSPSAHGFATAYGGLSCT